jgi:hypothetical protein
MHELQPLIWLTRMCVSSVTLSGSRALPMARRSFWIPSSASGISAAGLVSRGSITTGASIVSACDRFVIVPLVTFGEIASSVA